MQLIKNNPFRRVGLLVGASAQKQQRHVSRILQYLNAEQEIPKEFTEFGFDCLGNVVRTIQSVSDSAAKLNLDTDKMSAAIFWFYSGNPITDEPAFDSLKEADDSNPKIIWSKLTASGDVSQKNSSAFHNLSTLLLCNSFNGSSINSDLFQQGITLKLKFLESDFIKDFKALAADETHKTTKKELQIIFLKQVQSEIEKSGGITSNKFLQILNQINFSAKDEFLKSFIQKPIEQIEKKIEESKSKRKANPKNGISIGKNLFEQTADNLSQLKSVLGNSNLKYTSISDKIADEVLQCGIDYFNSQTELDNKEAGNKSLELFRKAKSIAAGGIINQRCDDQTEGIKEQIRLRAVTSDLDNLKGLIDDFGSRTETVANASQLLSSARQYLSNVKATLGSTDELYLGLSSRIASDAQSMCVSEINKLQERFGNTFDNATKIATLLLLKTKVNEAWDVTTTIGAMDLRPDFRTRYTSNRSSLSNLKTQLAGVNTGGGRSSSSSSSGGGCYIATMAYGDYDHPQVMILRKFRDDVLEKSQFGKWFIKTYYHLSPTLVEQLKNKKAINNIIRKTLNQFIKLIK